MAERRFSRHLMRVAAVGALVASVLALAGPATAGASSRVVPRVPPTYAALGIANAKTSNGVSWDLLVSYSPSATGADVDVALEKLVAGTDFEFHSWKFAVNSSVLSFSGKSGTFNLGSEASPVVPTFDLSFKATSSKAGSCVTGKETIYTGSLSGEVTLVTGLSGGGTVKGSFTFGVIPPTITVDQGCVLPSTNTCASEVLAGSSAVGATSSPSVFAESFTLPNSSFKSVGLSSQTTLSAPKGATRTDVGADIEKAGKVFATYASKAVKMASSGGIVTGSATISGGKPGSFHFPCSYKGKTYSVTEHFDNPANYSGKFSATMAIGPDLKAPTSTKTGYYQVEKSKAT